MSATETTTIQTRLATAATERATLRWFALRDLKRPNAKLPAYRMLSEAEFEVFTPMRNTVVVRAGRRERVTLPFMQDLLFVRSSRERLDPVISRVNTLQYRYVRGGKYCDPMIVRTPDMERFIHAVRSTENPRYYQPSEVGRAMIGRRVRIVGGPLDTYEGNLLSIRGSVTPRLMVGVPNLLTASVEVRPEYIRFL